VAARRGAPSKQPGSLGDKQVAFVSAALRHVRDAERLLEAESTYAPSFDQAWHLAGFGPECVRKALLTERLGDKALGHELGAEAGPLLDWLLSLDAGAWRYGAQAWVGARPLLKSWQPDARYARTGTYSQAQVRELVALARHLVDTTIANLWADGVLETPDV
jgi:hypothetical protein